MKVVIIGGGVMGLMTARLLAKAGCEVVLLERGQIGHEASWAGGGIVSPLYPWRYSTPVTALASVAQKAYPLLAEELIAETEIDPELTVSGLLMLDADDARDAESWALIQEQEIQRWGGNALRSRMPGLAAGWQEGLWMPAIANIRNPRLLKALRRALVLEGVMIYEQANVRSWQYSGGRVLAAVAADGCEYEADVFVICGGAWSNEISAQAHTAPLAVRPVRGQMLLYRLEPGALPCMVMAAGRYVIPRRDGHILCGSTLEETGFDKSTTSNARSSLIVSAERLWPALAGLEPLAHWAGLRPAAPNGIPFIGRVPDRDNLWVNAGHFRNGLVLAPASAQLLVDQLLGRATQLDARPYQLPSALPVH
ncbi:MAG: glycine oxidase ThiO [Pedobacter sp.]|nr:glycine oxidase ThiO [Pedobacter sp.]